MEPLIGIDDGLTNVKQALEAEGYRVLPLDQAGDADALVISGMDENFLGDQTIKQAVPVVSASGRSADEVVAELQERLQRQS